MIPLLANGEEVPGLGNILASGNLTVQTSLPTAHPSAGSDTRVADFDLDRTMRRLAGEH